ncbi:MAG: hypothetical protein ACLGID_22135 [Gammaproteobacteria bacterium]|jgi:hypothetical protein
MKEETTIILGDEYDDILRETLCSVLIKNGAIGIDNSWGVGGTQEIETLVIRLGSNLIKIEAETFIGLTISGPKTVVEEIALQVSRHTIN